MTTTKGRLDGRTYMLSAAVLAIVAWGAIKALLFFGHPAEALAVMAGVVGAAIVASLTLDRRLDEAGRAAVRFAWYWGGGGAMALTVAALAVYAAAGAPFLDAALRGGWTPVELIALGGFGIASAEVAGFAIAGAAWWLKR
jgi:hypothetical protein